MGPGTTVGRRSGTPVGRRVFLGMVGLGAAGIVTGATVQSGLGRLLRPVTNGSGGLASLIPGSNSFRIYTVTDGFPQVPSAGYRLRIGGLVDNPVELSLAELSSLPRTTLVRDFQCVTGWRVPKVRWDGVLLSDLLDHAGVQPAARALAFDSFDGIYTESLTLDQARRNDVIVAYGFEGGPVSAEHGGPVRLYVAPMYGYKSAKWLGGIRVVDKVEPGYWEQQGYDVDAWVGNSNGRHDAPTS